jgi:hypothetical protein
MAYVRHVRPRPRTPGVPTMGAAAGFTHLMVRPVSGPTSGVSHVHLGRIERFTVGD